MIRTLKKTISDVTISNLKSDPAVVEQIITDLEDPYDTNIKLYADNTKYISKLLQRPMDFISLFDALNIVNDEILNRVYFSISGPELGIGHILRDYGDMLYRYDQIYSWVKTNILLAGSEIFLIRQFTPDEIAAIKQIVKDQCAQLAKKLESTSSDIEKFINVNANKRTHANIVRQMATLNEYIGELRLRCIRSIDLA